MREVDFNTYKLLYETKSVSKSAIPKSVLKSDIFQNLVSAEILESLKLGRGFKIKVVKENEFEKSILMSKSWTFDSVDQIYNYTSWIDIYETFTDTQLLGFLLYNVYFLYLILGSFILLVAMIGSIFLTLTKKKEKKFQSIEKQVFVEISKSLFTK